MNKKVCAIAAGLGIISFALPGLSGQAIYCTPKAKHLALASELEKQEGKYISGSAEIKETLKISAKSSIVVSAETGEILYGDNIHEKLAIASMTKMMTMLLFMEEVEAGRISLETEAVISEYAASQEGSECVLEPGGKYKAKELLKSVVVASANDSAVAIAELVSGSEELFAKKMNERAAELNMKNTHFENATGLDAEGHYSTAYDMTILARELSKHKLVAEMGKTWMYDMEHPKGRVSTLANTNRLVRTEANLVLGKTGHTDNAGYCITSVVGNDKMKVVSCVMGVSESKTRFEEITKLNTYALSNFETKMVVNADIPAASIRVKSGKEKEVQVFPERSIFAIIKKGEKLEPVVEKNLPAEIKAPVRVGDKVGEMRVIYNEKEEIINLVAGEDVPALTTLDIVKKIIVE